MPTIKKHDLDTEFSTILTCMTPVRNMASFGDYFYRGAQRTDRELHHMVQWQSLGAQYQQSHWDCGEPPLHVYQRLSTWREAQYSEILWTLTFLGADSDGTRRRCKCQETHSRSDAALSRTGRTGRRAGPTQLCLNELTGTRSASSVNGQKCKKITK